MPENIENPLPRSGIKRTSNPCPAYN